jgi:hypothetical protein
LNSGLDGGKVGFQQWNRAINLMEDVHDDEEYDDVSFIESI